MKEEIMTIWYEEKKIKEMLLLKRFQEKAWKRLYAKAKKDNKDSQNLASGASLAGLYLAMKDELNNHELKIIFPDLF